MYGSLPGITGISRPLALISMEENNTGTTQSGANYGRKQNSTGSMNSGKFSPLSGKG
jgi:hypothetical protein